MGLFDKIRNAKSEFDAGMKEAEASPAPQNPERYAAASAMPTDDPQAHEIIMKLARRPEFNDQQVRHNIIDFVAASGQPTDLQALLSEKKRDPDVFERPWIWLVSAMRSATAGGDWHTAAAGYWWAIDWCQLLPSLTNADKFDLTLEAIPERCKVEIESIGRQAASALEPGFPVVGDATGAITAGMLASATFDSIGA